MNFAGREEGGVLALVCRGVCSMTAAPCLSPQTSQPPQPTAGDKPGVLRRKVSVWSGQRLFIGSGDNLPAQPGLRWGRRIVCAHTGPLQCPLHTGALDVQISSCSDYFRNINSVLYLIQMQGSPPPSLPPICCLIVGVHFLKRRLV